MNDIRTKQAIAIIGVTGNMDSAFSKNAFKEQLPVLMFKPAIESTSIGTPNQA